MESVTEWLEAHHLKKSLLETYGITITERELSIPVHALSGEEAFVLRRKFYGEQKYQVDPPGAKRGFQLYGLPWTARAIKDYQEAIVVEGFSDFLALRKSWVENCCAILGSKLTPSQQGLLANLCRRVIVWADGDSTGETYARAVGDLAVPFQVMGAVIAGYDPAELLAARGWMWVCEAVARLSGYAGAGAAFVKLDSELAVLEVRYNSTGS